MSDLSNRLRKRADQFGMVLCDPPRPTTDNVLLNEAADRLDALERENAELRELAYAKTDKGPMLWKDVWQQAVDAHEWYRSSANPIWEEVRASEREATIRALRDAKGGDL